MWMLGHCCASYLVIKSGYHLTGRELDGKFILYILLFANLPDALHIGPLRALTHNVFGTFLIAVFFLWLFRKYDMIPEKYVGALFIATFVHILCDQLMGSYYLFYPFDTAKFAFFGWNSFEQLFSESVLALIFFPVFVLSGDFTRLRVYISLERERFWKWWEEKKGFRSSQEVEGKMVKDAGKVGSGELLVASRRERSGLVYYLDTVAAPYVFFVLFVLFTIGQLSLSLYMNHGKLMDGIWWGWLNFVLFSCLLVMLSVIFYRTEPFD